MMALQHGSEGKSIGIEQILKNVMTCQGFSHRAIPYTVHAITSWNEQWEG